MFVVEVREGRSEFRVVDGLAEAGITAYVPALLHWRRLRDGRRCDRTRQALVAGYVFAWSDRITADLGAILAVRGVYQVLGGDDPLELRGDWLERVLILETFGAFDYTRDRKPAISLGQQIRIIAGPFTGLLASVTALGDNGKVRVKATAKFAFGTITLSRDKVEPLATGLGTLTATANQLRKRGPGH